VGLLLVLVLAVALCLVVLLPVRLLSHHAGQQADIRRDGVQSLAVITRIWATGVTASDKPRFGMLLSVEPERGEPFVVEHSQTVPRLQVPRIRPGHVITVKYLPSDPTRVVVVSLG
jgi:hypothetical protein